MTERTIANIGRPIKPFNNFFFYVSVRPLWVKLLGENRPLSADNTYELSCEVVGSRPLPTITWWKGSIQMTSTREMVSAQLFETPTL